MNTWNWIGLQTLFLKEIKRFSKNWLQSVLTPVITTSLYFLVFGVVLGNRLKTINGVPYIEFVLPGLMMITMIRNGFINPAASLFRSKISRVFDLQVAPLGAAEILIGYVGAAMIRALLVGALVWGVALLFTGFKMYSLGWTLFFAIAVSVAATTAGLLNGLFANTFEQLNVVPNFVLVPLTFIGGVFYSLKMLPSPWDTISHFNPIFYMVDGLRYGILGISEVSPLWSSSAIALLDVLLVTLALFVLSRGYRLRN